MSGVVGLHDEVDRGAYDEQGNRNAAGGSAKGSNDCGVVQRFHEEECDEDCAVGSEDREQWNSRDLLRIAGPDSKRCFLAHGSAMPARPSSMRPTMSMNVKFTGARIAGRKAKTS